MHKAVAMAGRGVPLDVRIAPFKHVEGVNVWKVYEQLDYCLQVEGVNVWKDYEQLD